MNFNMFNSWEDPVGSDRLQVVFHHRFKDYGAYQVRRLYHRNKVIAMAIAAIVTSGPLLSFMVRKEVKVSVQPSDEPKKLDTTIIISEQNPFKKWLESGSRGGTNSSAGASTGGSPGIGDDGPPLFGLKTFGFKPGKGSGEDGDDLPRGDGPGGDEGKPKKGSGGAPISIPCRFPHGEEAFIEYIRTNFKVPPSCLAYWAGGTARVKFMVNEKGFISRVEVLETSETCPDFKAETIKVFLNSPKWIAGTVNGKLVGCWRETSVVVTFD